MLKTSLLLSFYFLLLYFGINITGKAQSRTTTNFNNDWKFSLENDADANMINYSDHNWRTLNLPHDWSIEGNFSKDHPTTFNEAALPAGIGWYRKAFTLPLSSKDKRVFIKFDGVYKNSEVWINGEYLGKRPNGYISFEYELTQHLKFGKEKNLIAVKVDNSAQPDSRWYSGSGIYRNVWLKTVNKVAVQGQNTFITTPIVNKDSAVIFISTKFTDPHDREGPLKFTENIYYRNNLVFTTSHTGSFLKNEGWVFDPTLNFETRVTIKNPFIWSVENPNLYRYEMIIQEKNKELDRYETHFGIRTIHFDSTQGFFLNNKPLKILGVCMHHDLGALGAAVNTRAIERQLQILKDMGCNAIRTAHNPPSPELLDLCDKMGFLVMDEAFDMWKKRKNKQDYHLEFDKWHKQDLEDQIKRDRNHPSVFMWSIGNEIREQFDSSGTRIAKELVDIVKSIDSTRPVTSALTETVPEKNFIWQSKALDVLGFNYKIADYAELPKRFPGQKFIASETMSALASRGDYDMPSDSNRLWPPDSKKGFKGNEDMSVSAYDNVYAYWGSTHEAGWLAVKNLDFMAGLFVWSGFDFLGEPVPYEWPARSSYYGIIDLAGFPKDVYYMYQSEWTSKPVLHLFPHWNLPTGQADWQPGKVVDVWAYYNNADEVELFLNGKSLGKKSKTADKLHVSWKVMFEPGTLKAVSRKSGKVILTKEIKTAGAPAKIELVADRKLIKADGKDLSFITVRVLDKDGNIVPDAGNKIRFTIQGAGTIAATDNGFPADHQSFKSNDRNAYNGLCLVIVQASGKPGKIKLHAASEGISTSSIEVRAQ